MVASTPFSIGGASESNSSDDASSKTAPRQQQTSNGNNSGAEAREKYHAGSSKWGKYKKREQEAKKKRRANQENIATTSEGSEPALSSGALDLSSSDSYANVAFSTDAQATGAMKENFDFPDGGWVCSQCQNYNFKGRVKCNRCHKSKSGCDQDGKPKHLIRQIEKESVQQTQQQPSKRKQAISESDLPQQCYGKT